PHADGHPERSARRVQHAADSTARRRQRAERSAATADWAPVRPDSAVRLHPALRGHPDRCVPCSRGAAIQLPDRLAPVMSSASKPRVVSGMRPTGRLHIGHLVGALSNWVKLQEQYDCYYFIADWHALTSEFANTGPLLGYAFDNVADWIGAGLDPERS